MEFSIPGAPDSARQGAAAASSSNPVFGDAWGEKLQSLRHRQPKAWKATSSGETGVASWPAYKIKPLSDPCEGLQAPAQ